MFGKKRIGIMGTGKIAGIMADTIKKTKGVTLYAVASRTQVKADEFAKAHGVKVAYGSYQDLAADPKVDLIYVATPNSEHYDNVKLCITGGKAVLCEKPFMLNEQQAKEIFEYAADKKVFVAEAMWIRFMPFRNKIYEVLSSNVIGTPVMLTANLGYNVAYKDRISQPSLGGGALLDLGVYVLNFASMFFGPDVSDIVPISTYNQFGMDMQDSISLRYKNGQMATLNCSALGISDRRGVIYGTKGYIEIENINNFESLAVYDNEHHKISSYKRPKQITGYEYELTSCIHAIREGWLECPEMPHNETLRILNMMDFIRKQLNVSFTAEGGAAALPVNYADMVDTTLEEHDATASSMAAEEPRVEDSSSLILTSDEGENESPALEINQDESVIESTSAHNIE